MQEVYAALMLHESGKPIEAEAVKKILESVGASVDESKIKALVASLQGVNIDEALKHKVLEPEIIDHLLHLKSDVLNIGQAKGKFGGGKRRAWRQTQRKTKEGNILTFAAMAVVGDKKGHVGIGYGRAKETGGRNQSSGI